MHAKNVLNDLLLFLSGNTNLNGYRAAYFQTAWTDGAAVGISSLGAEQDRGCLCRPRQFNVPGKCHLLTDALQKLAAGTAVQNPDIRTHLIGNAVGSHGIA